MSNPHNLRVVYGDDAITIDLAGNAPQGPGVTSYIVSRNGIPDTRGAIALFTGDSFEIAIADGMRIILDGPVEAPPVGKLDTVESGQNAEISAMIGKTFASVFVPDDKSEMRFVLANGDFFRFYHYQDCCENVEIEEVIGDVTDLVGSPMLMAEESTTESYGDGMDLDSTTWTFYKFATNKGYVTVRWLGTSNGYYSERVSLDFCEVKR